jgi:hypothetical protein
MTLTAMEFLRRFVQHILPRGFVRIRQSGFLANICRVARVRLARTVLAPPSTAAPSTDATPTVTAETVTQPTWACPRCGATMDHRPDPLGALPGHGHARLRHLMSPGLPRPDRCARRRGRPRVGDRVSVVRSRAAGRAGLCPARPTSRAGRRRSRGAGPSIRPRPRPGIPIPAPEPAAAPAASFKSRYRR